MAERNYKMFKSPSQPLPGASPRPPSSISRPSSALSQRTASRISHRPLSRLSRPATRQASRIAPLCQSLITNLTGFNPEQEDFDDLVEAIIRRLDLNGKHGPAPDFRTVQNQLKNFSRKARIQSHDELAEAIEMSSKKLRSEIEKGNDLDSEISVSKVPEHLQFLFLLSEGPTASTLIHAEDIIERSRNPSGSSSKLTWAEILKEEPFEGQHWQGAYGLPSGSIADQWEQGSHGSDSSLSPLSDSDYDNREDMYSLSDHDESTDITEQPSAPSSPRLQIGRMPSQEEYFSQMLQMRTFLEKLQKQQYWRQGSSSTSNADRTFDLGDPSTLYSSFQRVTKGRRDELKGDKFIMEHDAVREIIMSLQGRSSVLFEEYRNDQNLSSIVVSTNAPHISHLTPSAQRSILSKFADINTSMTRIRDFVKLVMYDKTETPSPQKQVSRTIEAFSEALERQIILFELELARKEEIMLQAPLHPAWLSMEQIHERIKSSPSYFASQLLDTLFEAIQQRNSFGDTITASSLMHVFQRTAEPVWVMLGRWLRDGVFMPEASNSAIDYVSLPQEFFIEANELDLVDPDFWSEGYVIRSRTIKDSEHHEVPSFLISLAERLLSAGKSVGLLRILGRGRGLTGFEDLSVNKWPTFQGFMTHLAKSISVHGAEDEILSSDNLSLLLSDHVLPICASAEKDLRDVLYSDCELVYHLHAIQGLFLHMKGDVMSDFCDMLFTAVDGKKTWTDHFFLNTAFRDASELIKSNWIETGLVRLSYKSSWANARRRSVTNFDGLKVEYTAPFPLIFIFDASSHDKYNSIFVLILQLRRAKAVLDNILLRKSAANIVRTHDELKFFYTTRSKLSWFVNTFLNFICSHVLHVEVGRFNAALKDVGSLDDIISLHHKYIQVVEQLCLLGPTTSKLHRALIAILDMSILFSDCFAVFSGDNTLNTSRSSATHSRRHRSRRQRRERRNVVSFVPVQSIRYDDSSSSESDIDESIIPDTLPRETEASFAIPSMDESIGDDFFARNEKILKDLDALVRYIRREVDRISLADSGSQTLGILAFSLQDWDL
ncbi:hypothetical protein PNOK_0366000 [Pyrrhoderma noxium]|uniref:Spindle pole body component n=1 Tax=Pyrrhoderma noxium TaxID=2282107 RepID=A0A286UN64_9AGAM|nr:hypothetical protein PNOK_0366000 [Pyrrhoderma noxium]